MNGLELIKHTAGGGVMTASGAPGGAVSLVKNGKIEFTNATEVHVDKCFDVPANPGDEPLYDNYLVVIRCLGSGNISVDSRLRFSGSDARGADYTRQLLRARDSDVRGTRDLSQTWARLMSARTTQNGGAHAYIYGPALPQPTAFRSVTVDPLSGASIEDDACTHSVPTAYDGITFLTESGETITGSLTIYGFTKQSVV